MASAYNRLNAMSPAGRPLAAVLGQMRSHREAEPNLVTTGGRGIPASRTTAGGAASAVPQRGHPQKPTIFGIHRHDAQLAEVALERGLKPMKSEPAASEPEEDLHFQP